MPSLLRLLLPVVSFLVSSCLGVSAVVGTRQRHLGGGIGPLPGDQKPLIGSDGRPVKGAVVSTRTSFEGVNTADVLRQWGEPLTKEVSGSQQRWRYRTDNLAWRGAQVWLFIPIPLLVPVGHQKVTLTFEGDVLHKYTVDHGRERFFGYFLANKDSQKWRFNEVLREEDDPNCGFYGCY